MSLPARAWAVLALGAAVLGCGGVYASVARNDLVECGAHLRAVVDSPEKQAAQALVEKGWLVGDGFGFGGTRIFTKVCKNITADERITAGELQDLTDQAAKFPAGPIVADGNAALADLKTQIEAKRIHISFKSWSDDKNPIQAFAMDKGWASESCSREKDKWGTTYECWVQNDQQRFWLEWTKFKKRSEARDYLADDLYPHQAGERQNKHVLIASAYDLEASKTLATAFLGMNWKKAPTMEQVEAALRKRRYTDMECSEYAADDVSETSCDFKARSRKGSVTLSWDPSKDWIEEPKLELLEGWVYLDRKRLEVSARVRTKERSRQVLDEILTR